MSAELRDFYLLRTTATGCLQSRRRALHASSTHDLVQPMDVNRNDATGSKMISLSGRESCAGMDNAMASNPYKNPAFIGVNVLPALRTLQFPGCPFPPK